MKKFMTTMMWIEMMKVVTMMKMITITRKKNDNVIQIIINKAFLKLFIKY